MAGKHSAKSSKTPVIIISIVAVLIAVVIGVVVFLNLGDKTNSNSTESTTESTTVQVAETENLSDPQQNAEDTTKEEGVTIPENEGENVDVVVPTNGDGEIRYFNATYVPSYAIDADSEEECSLKEVFGSSYAGGVLTFNEDGTFTDSLTSLDAGSGAYVVEGDSITATYSNDKNMTIEVEVWDNGTPLEFHINYGGYEVYFKG